MRATALLFLLTVTASGCVAPQMSDRFDLFQRRAPQTSTAAEPTSAAPRLTSTDRTSTRGPSAARLASASCNAGGG
jgi:hypothetical protein